MNSIGRCQEIGELRIKAMEQNGFMKIKPKGIVAPEMKQKRQINKII